MSSIANKGRNSQSKSERSSSEYSININERATHDVSYSSAIQDMLDSFPETFQYDVNPQKQNQKNEPFTLGTLHPINLEKGKTASFTA